MIEYLVGWKSRLS